MYLKFGEDRENQWQKERRKERRREPHVVSEIQETAGEAARSEAVRKEEIKEKNLQAVPQVKLNLI